MLRVKTFPEVYIKLWEELKRYFKMFYVWNSSTIYKQMSILLWRCMDHLKIEAFLTHSANTPPVQNSELVRKCLPLLIMFLCIWLKYAPVPVTWYSDTVVLVV